MKGIAMQQLDEVIDEPIRLRPGSAHPPSQRARRFGSASLDRSGRVLGCDETWEREIGAPVGTHIDAAVSAADVPYLRSLLARTDDGLSVAVRTGHRDSDVSLLLHLEGSFRNGAWHVIGMPTFLPRHTDGESASGAADFRDPLTGLLDRDGFDGALGETLRRCTLGDGAALLLIDLDQFERFNDAHGHGLGDQLLKAVGMRIDDALREGDCAARFGGDEFAVILRRVTQLDARIAAERILSAVRSARAAGTTLMAGVQASIGMVLLRPGDDVDVDEAMTRADLALYAAKANGRSGVVEYPTGDPDSAARLRVRMSWGQRLHRAIERNRLELRAQPIVDLDTGDLAGCDLVLHLHDGDELLRIDAFRAHAVRAGLSERLDHWLLHRLVEEATDGSLPIGSVPIGVHVSGSVLEDRSLAARLQDDLQRHGVDPARIVVSISDANGAELERTRASAMGLRQLGVGLALDGFGGRSASLADLRDLPFTQVRLDSGFGSARDAGAFDDTMVAFAVAVGREFGLDVVATGIATPGDVQRLRALGIGLGSGELFGDLRQLSGSTAFPGPRPLI